MSRGFLLVAAFCAAVGVGTERSSAEPKSPLVPGGAYVMRHPSYQPENPDYGVDLSTARPHVRYGQYPWYGSAWGVPTYNWGCFGVVPYPDAQWHKCYHREYLQWQQWRRY